MLQLERGLLSESLQIFRTEIMHRNFVGTTKVPLKLCAAYKKYEKSRYGYGSAKSVILFIIVLVISVIQVNFFKGREVEA